MLFNSFPFLFVFLPVVLLGYQLLADGGFILFLRLLEPGVCDVVGRIDSF